MAYATYAQIKVRAGRFGGAFEVAGKKPDQTDIEGILTNISAELDAAIRGVGFDPSTMGATVKDALVDLAAYGALARALPAASPGAEAVGLADRAAALYSRGLEQIASRKLPALAQLEGGAGGQAGPGPGSLWMDEPSYGSEASVVAEELALRDTNLSPAFTRDMSH